MSLISRIDSIFVPAIDTEAAAHWYKSMFGMTEVFRSAGHIGLRVDGAASSTTALTLVPVADLPDQHFVAFNFFTPDPHRLHAALRADGREVTEIDSNGSLTWFDFVDIAGNRVNICHFAEN